MKRASILGLAVFVLVAAAALAAIWTQILPEYRASAEVRVRSVIPRLVFATETNGTIPFYESFVNTQVSIIRSVRVLRRVLDHPEVQETQWYRGAAKSLLQRLRGVLRPPLERLLHNLSVGLRPKTEIIEVSLDASSFDEACVVVNTVLEEYVKYVGQTSDAAQDDLYRQLVDQYKSLEHDIQARETVCAELQRRLGTPNPQERISSRRIHLDAMEMRVSELRGNVALLEWEIEHGAADDSNNVPAASAGSEKGSASLEQQLARAKREEQLMRAELAKQEAEFQELSEAVKQLEAEFRELIDAVEQL
ncbi:MAG: hypothetical protein JW741_03065 [Sedimentisphaerales bacterium]|nr:hypothetical protein [Sedimentisphaerales bacterium]